MDVSSLLFAFCLLFVGVWLIVSISGDYKEQRRHEQRIPDRPRRNLRAGHNDASRARTRVTSNARQPSTPAPVETLKTSSVGVEKVGTVDQLQHLNVAFLRETFERFQRDL